MAAALKKAGKPVSFITLDGEDHWLSRGATRLRMLTGDRRLRRKEQPARLIPTDKALTSWPAKST